MAKNFRVPPPPAGGAPSPATGGSSIAASAPQSQAGGIDLSDPTAIQNEINRLQTKVAPIATTEHQQKLVEDRVKFFTDQFNALHGEKKQQEGFAQQEKLLTERGEQSDKKMQEMFEQQDKRLAQSEAFQNDMQGRREQQRTISRT